MNEHVIPDYVKNSTLRYCIDEYVRSEKHQRILKDKWFGMLTIEDIAEKHQISETSVKRVVYGIGDAIILKAEKMN